MITVTKEMTINDILSKDRYTAAIMMSYGMGCLGCPHAQMESIEDAAAAHGVDADALIDALNDYFIQKGE